MPPVLDVWIWYGDQTLLTGQWADLPATNVQVIVWRHVGGGRTWGWGVDAYADIAGHPAVKQGGSIPTRRFNTILDEAKTRLGWMTD